MTDSPERFVDALVACGWFEALPAEALDPVRAEVGRVVKAGGRPWVGLVSVAVDSQYLLDDEPYAALLRQFADASWGALVPSDIEESSRGGLTRLSFTAGGRRFDLDLPSDPDDPPPAFYDAINRALSLQASSRVLRFLPRTRSSRSTLRFIELKDLPWGPIPGFALTTVAAFERAVTAGLVPR